jgi:hypothetical protein
MRRRIFVIHSDAGAPKRTLTDLEEEDT